MWRILQPMKKTTLPKLKAKALDLFNKVVKLRRCVDGVVICYTCGKPMKYGTSDCQAGHYLSRGAYPSLTFNSDNCRPQCYRCNCHLHGNTVEFRERLIEELGVNYVVRLEASRHTPVKYSRSDYEEMIERYKREIFQITDEI